MKKLTEIGLSEVQAVYSGPEGTLWERIMGEQIHIGGMNSSMDLAQKAGITQEMRGVDFCCCNGAGIRFLLRFQGVSHMIGIDATETVVEQARERCAAEGYAEDTEVHLADVCANGLPEDSVDFVWGEDAWCYVVDKAKLIAEAARVVKPGGVIAFTDWMEGPSGLSPEGAQRLMRFMKFPSLYTLEDYTAQLTKNDCTVEVAENTERFAPAIDLYLNMLQNQLGYDALKIINFDMPLMTAMGQEMIFMQQLAQEEKIIQGLVVARKQ